MLALLPGISGRVRHRATDSCKIAPDGVLATTCYRHQGRDCSGIHREIERNLIVLVKLNDTLVI
jgi:hypothetical protein